MNPPWVPALPGTGRYRVSAYVPAVAEEPLGTATYRIGATAVPVDQEAVKDRYAALGDHLMSPAAVVTLGDASDVAGRKLVADGVRFQAVTALSLATSTRTITHGRAVRVAVTLHHVGGRPMAGRAIDLYWRAVGTTGWRRVHRGSTGGDGVMRVDLSPRRNTELTARYAPTSARAELPAATGNVRVDVRPFVQAWLDRTTVPLGGTASIRVAVSPSHAGQSVHLQRYADGAWRSIAIRTLSSTSGTTFVLRPGSRGDHRYRVYKPADADHVLAVTGTLLLRVT